MSDGLRDPVLHGDPAEILQGGAPLGPGHLALQVLGLGHHLALQLQASGYQHLGSMCVSLVFVFLLLMFLRQIYTNRSG